jgi:hypothetical protein
VLHKIAWQQQWQLVGAMEDIAKGTLQEEEWADSIFYNSLQAPRKNFRFGGKMDTYMHRQTQIGIM